MKVRLLGNTVSLGACMMLLGVATEWCQVKVHGELVLRLGRACHGAFFRRDSNDVLRGDMWCEILTK